MSKTGAGKQASKLIYPSFRTVFDEVVFPSEPRRRRGCRCPVYSQKRPSVQSSSSSVIRSHYSCTVFRMEYMHAMSRCLHPRFKPIPHAVTWPCKHILRHGPRGWDPLAPSSPKKKPFDVPPIPPPNPTTTAASTTTMYHSARACNSP